MAATPDNERGVALLLTITLIGLIVILTMQFSKSIRSGLYETANFDDGIRLGAIAKSGFNCAMAVLYEDGADVDSYNDDWASLNLYSSYSSALFDNGGRFEIQIADLSGKIQVNRLIISSGENKGEYNEKQKDLLARLLKLEAFNLEEDRVNDILDAIKDWMDEDDEATGFGAEDSYYQSLEPPYSCRNAAFESLDELLLVKGITHELFYGTDETPGISAYLAVQGDGKININTADPLVLEALSDDLDSTMIGEMVEYRSDDKNDLNRSDWYKSALGTSEDYIDPTLITTKSSYFEITSRGVRDDRSKGVTGVARRSGKTLTVLSWQMF